MTYCDNTYVEGGKTQKALKKSAQCLKSTGGDVFSYYLFYIIGHTP